MIKSIKIISSMEIGVLKELVKKWGLRINKAQQKFIIIEVNDKSDIKVLTQNLSLYLARLKIVTLIYKNERKIQEILKNDIYLNNETMEYYRVITENLLEIYLNRFSTINIDAFSKFNMHGIDKESELIIEEILHGDEDVNEDEALNKAVIESANFFNTAINHLLESIKSNKLNPKDYEIIFLNIDSNNELIIENEENISCSLSDFFKSHGIENNIPINNSDIQELYDFYAFAICILLTVIEVKEIYVHANHRDLSEMLHVYTKDMTISTIIEEYVD